MTNLITPLLNKVPAPVGNGFELNSSLREYAFFDPELSAITNGSTSFTIGLWANFPELLSLEESTNEIPLVANANFQHSPDDDPTGYMTVCWCEAARNYMQAASVRNQSGEYVSTTDTPMQDYTEEWTYNTISIDIENGVVEIYTGSPDTGYFTHNASLPQGTITPPDSHVTAFNETGGLEFYHPANTPLKNVKLRYADITVWDRALTTEEIDAICSSPAIAGGRTDYIFNSSTQMRENIISSAGFEDDESLWWDLSENTSVMTDENGLNHYCNITSSGYISQSVYLENSQSYFINLQCKGSAQGKLYFRVPGTTDKLFSTSLNDTKNSDWHNESISFTPDTYANRNLELVIELPAGDSDDFLSVDNVSLT